MDSSNMASAMKKGGCNAAMFAGHYVLGYAGGRKVACAWNAGTSTYLVLGEAKVNAQLEGGSSSGTIVESSREIAELVRDHLAPRAASTSIGFHDAS